MEDHPLLQTVTSWPGRGPTELAFEALGFTIHKARQNRIIQFCGEKQSHLLHRYWDEIALETMQSLGQGAPDQRAFLIQPRYRSAFLDELFAARDFVEPRFPCPPLVKCLFDRFKKIYLDAEFRDNENAFFSQLRKAESERLGIETIGWSGKKREFVPFVEKFCSALAFERRRYRWRKKINGGLVFEVGVDFGGNPYCIGKPPLLFLIFHVDDPKYVFSIMHAAVSVVFDRLLPGFDVYAHCRDASDYVLGIRAYIELFDVIARSFENALARNA
jgi:hypothetical protein